MINNQQQPNPLPLSPNVSDSKLYFAYGSNLHPDQMEARCPGSTVVSSGVLKGYRLAFRGNSKRWGNGGVATIIPHASSLVYSVLYRMEQNHVEALDKWEGTPRVYRQIEVTVTGPGGSPMQGYTYQKNDTSETRPPSMAYFHQIWQNYRRFNLNERLLMEAVQESLNIPGGFALEG